MAEEVIVPIRADTTEFEEALKNLTRLGGEFGSQLSGGLVNAAVAGRSLEDVLRRIALNLASSALQQGLRPLQNLAGNLFSGLFSGVGRLFGFEKGGVVPFASGGVVSAPTYFPMGGNVGLMGEAGPEAVLPLQRGADGRMGVAAGGASTPVNIVQHQHAGRAVLPQVGGADHGDAGEGRAARNQNLLGQQMPELESFHDVRFPVAVSFGATGGPERRNEIVLMSSGREQRNARLSASRRRYDAGTGIRSLADLYDVIAFFEARRGSLHGFGFRDPFDMRSGRPDIAPDVADQAIGTGDGTARTFQLQKAYGDGEDAYFRPVTKPVSGTVRIAVDGVERDAGVDFTVDALSGVVTFAEGQAPGAGEIVTAGFEFDVPVRFDTEQLSVSLAAFKAGQIPTIPLIEILA